MGGTFNPVHHGHLRAAIEFQQAFNLASVAMLPCYQPVHRAQPTETALQRRRMLELAITACDELHVDAREMDRAGPSYTVDTLTEIRQQVGNDVAIYFAMGTDAFVAITQWHQWQNLFELANIVVMHRPGSVISVQDEFLTRRFSDFGGEHRACGQLYELVIPAMDISSTQIRQAVKESKQIQYLVPPAVANYIYQQNLYQWFYE